MLRSQVYSSKTPASRDLDSGIKGEALGLGRHALPPAGEDGGAPGGVDFPLACLAFIQSAAFALEEEPDGGGTGNPDASSVLSEMPKASSLFKAIINNKPEDASVSAQLETALSSNENVFTAKSTVRTVEEEPELFPNQTPPAFTARPAEEPEKLIVEDDDEE